MVEDLDLKHTLKQLHCEIGVETNLPDMLEQDMKKAPWDDFKKEIAAAWIDKADDGIFSACFVRILQHKRGLIVSQQVYLTVIKRCCQSACSVNITAF